MLILCLSYFITTVLAPLPTRFQDLPTTLIETRLIWTWKPCIGLRICGQSANSNTYAYLPNKRDY